MNGDIYIKLDEGAREIIDVLEKNGYEAYAVGGCVRDSVLGKIPFDWDITTSALPEKTKELFSDYTVIPTGIKHGTVTVVIS
ncbi:MAG: CCA tRNA nucleotidyltransferase, partial [Clostridia bacterium]|nr:CCA tRNA nucleotidyltransferase [Clostridia bacterium]